MPNCPHCETPLDEHEADRCMDACCAIKAGWKSVREIDGEWYGFNPGPGTIGMPLVEPVPHFATDTSAAMGLLTGLDAKKYGWRLTGLWNGSSRCSIWMREPPWNTHNWKHDAPTPAEAICRCFIKAKEAEKGS